ncbi:ribokinase [Mergibacter septicus]|uniref:ribokinase n=1 Tax=Mergibacter septicus TaxID=221402 RepID=UPI0021C4492B|nr:ribokinase [Mergibacter septicus]UTU47409.1 ribokinase [Mergibacter septicus]
MVITNQTKKNLVVLGSINADHVIQVPNFPRAGETLFGENYRIAYGGKGANQAVAVARSVDKNQIQPHFIGCIGQDPIGQEMCQAFTKDGIDTSYIFVEPNQTTGIAMIQVSQSGENSIVISAGANGDLTPKKVEQATDLLCQADWLLIQLETPLNSLIHASKIAKKAGAKIALNPAPAQKLPPELLSLIDLITPNETETELLTQIKVCDYTSACQAANIFHQQGIPQVIITLGAKGVFFSQQQGEQIYQQQFDGFKVIAKDTTAAGDTFNGALLSQVLEQDDWQKAIRFAQAAAAISVTRHQAQPSIPQREEIFAFLAQQD